MKRVTRALRSRPCSGAGGRDRPPLVQSTEGAADVHHRVRDPIPAHRVRGGPDVEHGDRDLPLVPADQCRPLRVVAVVVDSVAQLPDKRGGGIKLMDVAIVQIQQQCFIFY